VIKLSRTSVKLWYIANSSCSGTSCGREWFRLVVALFSVLRDLLHYKYNPCVLSHLSQVTLWIIMLCMRPKVLISVISFESIITSGCSLLIALLSDPVVLASLFRMQIAAQTKLISFLAISDDLHAHWPCDWLSFCHPHLLRKL